MLHRDAPTFSSPDPPQVDLSALAESTPIKLDLGCGARPLGPDWIGVDSIPYPQVSIVGDVNDVLSQIEPESIDNIYSAHFLEHVDDLYATLSEISRVLKVGGEMRAVVPHWSNPWQYSDPTHKRMFGLYTFDYLVESSLFTHSIPDYKARLPLRLEGVRLGFRVDNGYGLRTWVMRTLEREANRSPRRQELFEVNLAQIVPCQEVTFVLRRLASDQPELDLAGSQ